MPDRLKKTDEMNLWQSFKGGDKESFVLIYRHYFKMLVNYGSRFTSDPQLLEDAVQDLFISIWKRRDELDNLGHVDNPKFYLLRALRNQLIRNSRHDVFDQAEDIDDFLDHLVSLSVEQQTINQETVTDQSQKVRFAVSKLSPRQQEAINLRFYHGMSLDQISQMMGINKQAASNMLFKAYTVLRLTLKGYALLAISVGQGLVVLLRLLV
jgi:RNA polymerase sigma factor (sigma-70 family)